MRGKIESENILASIKKFIAKFRLERLEGRKWVVLAKRQEDELKECFEELSGRMEFETDGGCRVSVDLGRL